MRSRSVLFRALFTTVLVLSLLYAPQAYARIPIPVIINTGEIMCKVADLPPELATNPELANWVLGYKYSHTGIFWADFATWDEELVIFHGLDYSNISDDKIKMKLTAQYPFSQCDRNLWSKYWYVIIISPFLLLVLYIKAEECWHKHIKS